MNARPTGDELRHPWPRTDRTDRRATGYERDGLGPLLVRLQRQALTRLGLVATDRFLDVGCATGAAVRAAAEHVHIAVGVDQSPTMIRHARDHTRSHTGAHFLLARAEHLPFPTHTFSTVLCTTVLHYLDNPDRALAEMIRVLHPDGRLVIGDLLQASHAARVPPRGTPRSWTGLTVIDHQRTLTPLGYYVIVLAHPDAPATPGTGR